MLFLILLIYSLILNSTRDNSSYDKNPVETDMLDIRFGNTFRPDVGEKDINISYQLIIKNKGNESVYVKPDSIIITDQFYNLYVNHGSFDKGCTSSHLKPNETRTFVMYARGVYQAREKEDLKKNAGIRIVYLAANLTDPCNYQ